MTNGAAGGTAAAAAAIAQATKASGAIVRVEPPDFVRILSRTEKPLVVMAQGGLVAKNHQYITSYKGLVFFTKSHNPLQFSSKVEIVVAKKIWIPA